MDLGYPLVYETENRFELRPLYAISLGYGHAVPLSTHIHIFFTLISRLRSTEGSWQTQTLINNVVTKTGHYDGLKFVPIFRLRCSGTSQKFRKVCLFAPPFERYVFVNFSTNTATIGTKLSTRYQWAPTRLVHWSDESPQAFLGFRLSTDTISAKTVFFDTFFTNWPKGSTLQMLRQAK